MDSFERIMKAFRHESPDRTPFFEYCPDSKKIIDAVLGRACSYLHWDECLREKGWEKAICQTVIDRLDIAEFFGHSPLISPECYRRFIVPELRKLSEKIHRSGAFAVNASDGNLWSVIDDFLISSGVDGYLEIDLHAGMDLKKLKDEYGNRITFLGNTDCGNTLSFASPDKVRAATIKCIEDGLGNGGHIFTASNAITDSVPMENYFTMVNAFREYWSMPKLSL